MWPKCPSSDSSGLDATSNKYHAGLHTCRLTRNEGGPYGRIQNHFYNTDKRWKLEVQLCSTCKPYIQTKQTSNATNRAAYWQSLRARPMYGPELVDACLRVVGHASASKRQNLQCDSEYSTNASYETFVCNRSAWAG